MKIFDKIKGDFHLAFLEKNLPTIPSQQLEQLAQIIAAGSCVPLIAYMQQRASTENITDGVLQFVYELGFEFAIRCGAHDFIEEILNHDVILKYLDQTLLLQYAKKKQDAAFNMKVFTAIINSPSRNWGWHESLLVAYDVIYSEFRHACNAVLNASSMDSVADQHCLIRDVVFNTNVKTPRKLEFLRVMVGIHFDREAKNQTEPIVTNKFLNYIPTDPDCLQGVLCDILSYNHIATLHAFIQRFSLTSDQLLTTLINFAGWQSIQPDCLKLLLDAIGTQHAKYRFFYAVYQSMLLTTLDKAAFLQKNIVLFNPANTSLLCRNQLVNALDKTGRKIFIDKYSQELTFTNGSAFMKYIFDYDSDTVKKYLLATHTQVPDDSLLELEKKHSDDPELNNLILILISKSTYQVNKTDVFGVLYQLAITGKTRAILILLNNDTILNLLKQYHRIDGDSVLSSNDRGTLLPAVFAILAIMPTQWKELYASLPEPERKKVLKGCLPRALDSRQPTLGAYLIQSGHADLLQAINAIHSRLVCPDANNRSVFFIPMRWRCLEMNNTLRRFQLQLSVQHAANFSKLYTQEVSTLEQKITARKIAANLIYLKPLRLQHRTYYNNTSSILVTGKLKSRLHIQNAITGKASAGLSAASLPENDPKSLFTFFTRVPSMHTDQVTINHFSRMQDTQQSCFILNVRQFLVENPHIRFLVLGYYRNYAPKTVLLPCNHLLQNFNNQINFEDKILIPLTADINESLLTIYTKLFECLLVQYIQRLPEHVQKATIQELIHPKENSKLIDELLDFLPLEWCVPGDVALKLSFVDLIEFGTITYDLAALREKGHSLSDEQLQVAIKEFSDLKEFPFVVVGLLKIAIQRRLKATTNALLQIKSSSNPHCITYVYSPDELYEIESLAQLILEDLDNSRVYVHFDKNILSFESTLKISSNRDGAHHSGMARLRYALGMKGYEGQNALLLITQESFVLDIGEGQTFASLVAVRDALLTYELTNLLVSQQNFEYYCQHQGKVHPITGKGATNGRVALLKERLFNLDKAYFINYQYNCDRKQADLWVSDKTLLPIITATLKSSLNLPDTLISTDAEKITLIIDPHALITQLRQSATFYEGINVLTADGCLLMANRHHKGLASAGGHHGDTYSPKSIAYGLSSEFGLVFKEPEKIEQQVTILTQVNTFAKTSIYIVPAEALVATEKAAVIFKADPDEFDINSEVALTLAEMRGKQFYDVMPLSELCQYQLSVLIEYIKSNYSEYLNNLTITIDSQVDLVDDPKVTYKIPTDTFGRMQVNVKGAIPHFLREIFSRYALVGLTTNESEYHLDVSPFALLRDLKKSLALKIEPIHAEDSKFTPSRLAYN